MKKALLFIIVFLLGAFTSQAQTWTEKRTQLPPGTTITGTYTPTNAVPSQTVGGNQNAFFWDGLDKLIVGYFPDGVCGNCEWGNAMFGYAEASDDGASTSGAGTGWRLLWDSLNTQVNNNSGVGGGEITSMSCSGGVVTFVVASNSAQFLFVGQWILYQGMPTGLDNGMFQVASLSGGGNGVYGNLYTSWTYNDASCVDGTYSATGSTFTAVGEDTPTMPARRHADFQVFDSTRNAMWMGTGIADVNEDATVINSAHSGIADLYEMTKLTNWLWTEVCGFGSSVAGTRVPASSGPGSLCGQEYLTTTTSGPKVAGLPCLDMQPGGVSNGGNGGSCGYKFAVGAYDRTNDVIVIFGGQWNSSVRCEAVMYYPATNHWKNPLDTSCDGTHSPAARWTQAGTNIIDMGNGKMVMFGGTGKSTYNDTWILQTCSESNQSACSWTKLSPTTSPAVDPDPVMDYSNSLGKVVYVDKKSPAHTWFFDPSTNQWADQTGTGSGGQYLNGPSLTTALNGGTTPPYYSLGAIDQAQNTFVILNSCSTTTTPSCGTFRTQIWTLSLP